MPYSCRSYRVWQVTHCLMVSCLEYFSMGKPAMCVRTSLWRRWLCGSSSMIPSLVGLLPKKEYSAVGAGAWIGSLPIRVGKVQRERRRDMRLLKLSWSSRELKPLHPLQPSLRTSLCMSNGHSVVTWFAFERLWTTLSVFCSSKTT